MELLVAAGIAVLCIIATLGALVAFAAVCGLIASTFTDRDNHTKPR